MAQSMQTGSAVFSLPPIQIFKRSAEIGQLDAKSEAHLKGANKRQTSSPRAWFQPADQAGKYKEHNGETNQSIPKSQKQLHELSKATFLGQ
jgi:hypothetical protein